MNNEAAKTSWMQNDAKYWIDHFELNPHPEGGYFKEVYRSDEIIAKKNLPERYSGKRSFTTSFYFLLERNDISAFHRIKSDETWYYHDGSALEIVLLDKAGILSKNVIGLDILSGADLQLTIPKNNWFAARSLGEFTLVSCSVVPGFDFEDFELAKYNELIAQYPQHEELLKMYCI